MSDDSTDMDNTDTSGDDGRQDADTNASTATDQSSDTQTDSQSDKDAEKDWKAETEKWRGLARKHEAKVKELTPRAQRAKELEDAQKTEVEKLNDQLSAAQVELQSFRVMEIRRAAASAAGLDLEMAEFITAADADEAKTQAEKLAARLKTVEKKADFRQGARTTPPASLTRDQLIRGIAGYGN